MEDIILRAMVIASANFIVTYDYGDVCRDWLSMSTYSAGFIILLSMITPSVYPVVILYCLVAGVVTSSLLEIVFYKKFTNTEIAICSLAWPAFVLMCISGKFTKEHPEYIQRKEERTGLIFKYTEYYDEPYDCECCGTCFPDSKTIEVNGKVVWEKSHDGHLSGFESDTPIVDAILNEVCTINNEILAQQMTEEARHAWNRKYPGNYVASTPESWAESHTNTQQCYDTILNLVRDSTSSLDICDEFLLMRMVALWYEVHTGECVTIEKDV